MPSVDTPQNTQHLCTSEFNYPHTTSMSPCSCPPTHTQESTCTLIRYCHYGHPHIPFHLSFSCSPDQCVHGCPDALHSSSCRTITPSPLLSSTPLPALTHHICDLQVYHLYLPRVTSWSQLPSTLSSIILLLTENDLIPSSSPPHIPSCLLLFTHPYSQLSPPPSFTSPCPLPPLSISINSLRTHPYPLSSLLLSVLVLAVPYHPVHCQSTCIRN